MANARTLFIIACMILIAGSLAASFYLTLNMELVSSLFLGLIAFAIMAAAQMAVSRTRSIETLSQRVTTLSDQTLALAREIKAVSGRVETVKGELEQRAADQRERLLSELQVLETLIKQLAEGMVIAGEADASTGDDALWKGDLADDGGVVPEDEGERRDARMLERIRRSLESNRVDLYLQPVVTLPQRRVRYYEALTRLRDEEGGIIMPSDYIRLAEPAGMMPIIDNLLLFRSVQVVRRFVERQREVGLFCNISAHSLLDSEFFPQFIEYMEHNKELAGALFFEFGQSTVRGAGPLEQESLDALAELGFTFSLDKVTSLDIDFQDLADRGFRFVKVRADILLGGMQEAGARIHANDMRSYLARYGIDLIVERIESERSVVDLLDYDIGLGQGYLFGEPRLANGEAEEEPDAARAAG